MDASVLPLARASAADWLELTKPRITLMVVFTALVGFVTATAALALDRPAARGARRDRPRGRRRERPQPGDGARHRRPHAPHAHASDPGRAHPSRRGQPVRCPAHPRGARAARGALRTAGRPRGLLHLGELPVPLHAAQAPKPPRHPRRRGSGCPAARDRLGRRERQPRARAPSSCSPSSSCGRSRTSWRSPGSTATTTSAGA